MPVFGEVAEEVDDFGARQRIHETGGHDGAVLTFFFDPGTRETDIAVLEDVADD